MTKSSDETLELMGVLSRVDANFEQVRFVNDLASEPQRLMDAPGRAMESLLEGVSSSHGAMVTGLASEISGLADAPGRAMESLLEGLTSTHWATEIGFAAELGSVVEGLTPDATEVFDIMGDAYARIQMPSLQSRRGDFNVQDVMLPSSNEGILVLGTHFNVRVSRTPIPRAIESVDDGAAFKAEHQVLLVELEQSLRNFVETNLLASVGPNWVKRRVSRQMRDRWYGRQAVERAAGRPVFPAIQYADFMDLAELLCRSDNWNDVFEPFFKDREDVLVSLRRLNPVRRAIAHSRPLGRADVLTLVNEATRLFGAMGTRILN